MLEVNMSQNIECDNSIGSEMFLGMMILRNLMHVCEPFMRLYLSSRRGSTGIEVASIEIARRLGGDVGGAAHCRRDGEVEHDLTNDQNLC
jgi:hypothetical protein